MTNRSQAVLEEHQVLEIIGLIANGICQKDIAVKYGVSKKTISRINTGETWSTVSQRDTAKKPPNHNVPIPDCIRVSSAEQLIELLDEVTQVKNHFGFDLNLPLHWGFFDGHDGSHSIVTDGCIMWESSDLVSFAKRLSESTIRSSPIFSDLGKELGTFAIKNIMTKCIGERYTVEADAGGIVRLGCVSSKSILLKKKYIDIANKMRLDVRQAGFDSNFVYLTRAKTRTTAETASVVMACVAVVNPVK